MSRSKKYLFYFVHPAKFHLFRATINHLKAQGKEVEVLITGRDILEELVQKEGWEYTKIFPNGRKLKGVHIWVSAGIFLFLTLWKLLVFTLGKRYAVFVSDDLTTFIGRIRGVPSIFVTDDDLSAVPESAILMSTAHYIFAPRVCDLGRYNSKKLGYDGYKSLAHLHPNRFTPDINRVTEELRKEPYFFIRTVSATSTHDVGKRGITDDLLRKLIDTLSTQGRVVLNSERKLPDDLQSYVLDFNKMDVAHYIANAKLFISDSTTMCAEAAVLGTPAVEIDDWYADFKQYQELNAIYGLLQGFKPNDWEAINAHVNALLADPNLAETFQEKRKRMLMDKVDVSAFLIWLLEEMPTSFQTYLSKPDESLEPFKMRA